MCVKLVKEQVRCKNAPDSRKHLKLVRWRSKLSSTKNQHLATLHLLSGAIFIDKIFGV